MARLSEINLGLYRTFLQPWRARGRRPSSRRELLRRLHPSRLQFELFSDRNPLHGAGRRPGRARRAPTAGRSPPDNPFLAAQEPISAQIVAALDGWRDWRDAVGRGDLPCDATARRCSRRCSACAPATRRRAPGRAASPRQLAFVQQRIAELKARMGQGGLREAFVRAIIYVRLPELAADERGFAVLQQGARGAREPT